jgi:hypothetical protein
MSSAVASCYLSDSADHLMGERTRPSAAPILPSKVRCASSTRSRKLLSQLSISTMRQRPAKAFAKWGTLAISLAPRSAWASFGSSERPRRGRQIAPFSYFVTTTLAIFRLRPDLLNRDDFSTLLDRSRFRRIQSAPWTFIPRGDMPALIASALNILDIVGGYTRLDCLRGGLEGRTYLTAEEVVTRTSIFQLMARAKPSQLVHSSLGPRSAQVSTQ